VEGRYGCTEGLDTPLLHGGVDHVGRTRGSRSASSGSLRLRRLVHGRRSAAYVRRDRASRHMALLTVPVRLDW